MTGTGNLSLFEVIEDQDSEKLKDLLDGGSDPNVPSLTTPHWYPLHAAVAEMIDGGPIAAVLLLLSQGADVNGGSEDGELTPLAVAVGHEQMDVLPVLLKAGANPNVRHDEGDPLLAIAAEAGNLEMARILLDHGATDAIDDWGGVSGLTPLGQAARNLDIPMIELLLTAGASIHAVDDDGRPPAFRMPEKTQENAMIHANVKELLT